MLDRNNPFSKVLILGRRRPIRGRRLVSLLRTGRGDRLRRSRAKPGAATKAWAELEHWPGLAKERTEKLQALTAEVLNSMVHPRLRRLWKAAERRED